MYFSPNNKHAQFAYLPMQEEETERKAKILRHKKELMMIQQREGLKQLMQYQRKGKYLNFQVSRPTHYTQV